MLTIVLALSLLAHADDAATDDAPPDPAEPAVEDEGPDEEAPAAPSEVRNADFSVTVTRANGDRAQGHVKRLERGVDVYGDKGWTTEDKDLLFYVEGNNEYKKIPWSDVSAVSITIKDAKDFNCLYSSAYSPWMYECSIRLTSTVSTRNGKRYVADSGHKWRMVFDDDSEVEFWLKRHYAREQDAEVVGLEVGNPENYELYGRLQTQLRTEMKSELVTSLRF